MPVLTESSALGTRRVFAIDRAAITIGRSADNAVVVKDCTASKHHAEVRGAGEGRYFVRDLGSRNGTYVNGVRVAEQPLREGDEIRVGASRFRLLAAAPEKTDSGIMAAIHGAVGGDSRRFTEADIAGASDAPSAEGALDRMWALGRTMHLARDPIDFAAILTNGLIDLLGADRGAVVVLEEGGGPPTLRIDGDRDANETAEPPDPRTGAFRRAIESCTTVALDAGTPQNPVPRHVLAVPIAPHFQLVAVAYVERHAHRRPFSRRETKIAELQAALAGYGLLGVLSAGA